MKTLQQATSWELTLLDVLDPKGGGAGSLAIGDIDGDNLNELLIGGADGIRWYRLDSTARGRIYDGPCHVGLAVADLDADGRGEVLAGVQKSDDPEDCQVCWFKPTGETVDAPWQMHVIDPSTNGGVHDVQAIDIDGDGELEVIANAVYNARPCLYLYKRTGDITQPWQRFVIQDDGFEEALAFGDLNGDGKLEIVSGPNMYAQPAAGPLNDHWPRTAVAPGFREMCRVFIVDITGQGRGDIVAVESEYPDGQISWFENRLAEGEGWVEHPIDHGWNFAHSLHARRVGRQVRVFVAEMAKGGWDAPYNFDARVSELVSDDNGATWREERIDTGAGTHQAMMIDLDGDGKMEVVGKECYTAKVQLWKKLPAAPKVTQFEHVFVDREKPAGSIDIVPVDLTGDGKPDLATGSWWYEHGTWERFEIPDVYQVIGAGDVDGDGRMELIGITADPNANDWYNRLCSDLVWLKPIDARAGEWQMHKIGTGSGDWPHGNIFGPLGPDGRGALCVCYHDGARPEIFHVPDDPTQPWERRTLADIPYREELLLAEIAGSGRLDIIAGAHWLENNGDGTFTPHEMTQDFDPARCALVDINGNGRLDVLTGREGLDFDKGVTPWSELAWLEQPEDPREPWTVHLIDTVRCAHSVAAADIDGDGEVELICGEHNPFKDYRSRSRLMVYKKADPAGITWKRYVLDDRFEHHDGTRIVDLGEGRKAIASIGWKETKYTHLWKLRG